jgi:hypothetical protein
MYLKNLLIFNSGPTQKLDLEPQFNADGTPKPLVIVGRNGAGKTNLLSTIADAILELQVRAGFQDILPNNKSGQRYFFRMLGGATTTSNQQYEVSAARFSQAENSYFYRAKSGAVPEEAALERLRVITPFPVWDAVQNKEVIGDATQLKNIFSTESFTFFPVNRNEDAWWQSLRSEQPEEVKFAQRMSAELSRPLVLASSFGLLKPWLADVVLDQAIDASHALQLLARSHAELLGYLAPRVQQGTLAAINNILSVILDQPVYLTRGGRGAASSKLYLRDAGGAILLKSLDSLSTGQAALATIFLNILRYADMGRPGILLSDISGISIIDEIDAHLHSDLQRNVLPRLMRLFPQVQFVATSHAPLFAIGMDREFGSQGFSLIDLPSGLTISCERFSEFQKSFEYFAETKAFETQMQEAVGADKQSTIICEGETDPLYLKRAAEILGFSEFAENVVFDWIGTKEGGAAKNGGYGSLDNAVKLFKSNPNLVSVPLALIYDCDKPGKDHSQKNLLVISLPRNADNTIRSGGIENLLPPDVFEAQFYVTSTSKNASDDEITIKKLNKVVLCNYICHRGKFSDFIKFEPIIEKLALFVGLPRSADWIRPDVVQPAP